MLVVVGSDGILSYTVLQRTREIGIRIALGALPRQVVGLVMSGIGAMMVAGLVIGASALR